jgi:hypothetical protein
VAKENENGAALLKECAEGRFFAGESDRRIGRGVAGLQPRGCVRLSHRRNFTRKMNNSLFENTNF